MNMALHRYLVTLCLVASLSCAQAGEADVERILDQASQLARLHSLLVLHEGRPVIEHVRAGPGLSQPANIKSVSKTVLAALAGIALEKGMIEDLDQRIVELLDDRVPGEADARTAEITVGHALSMQTGLQGTSHEKYGPWVLSDGWVAYVLTRPFVDDPGGQMIYSTGSSHLVAAALTDASGRSLLELARDWLGKPLNIQIPAWMTDPQGTYFGGNEMLLSPRALALFGELYRNGGRHNGEQVIPAWWVEESWQPNRRSRWTGDAYGYGWFMTEIAGHKAYYGAGYGGQALYVLPDAGLTVVITADPEPPSPGRDRFDELQSLVGTIVRTFDSTQLAHQD